MAWSARQTLDEYFALSLYQQGKEDKEIAMYCRVKIRTVQEWREREGMEKNTPDRVRRRRKHELTPLERDSVEARKQGITYGQYKAMFFTPVVYIPRRRRIVSEAAKP